MNFFRNFSTDSCETTSSSLFWAYFKDEEGKTGVSSSETGIFEDEEGGETGKRCIFAAE